MISIYCTRRSDGAGDLVNKINELGGQAERSGLAGRPVSLGSFVVNWGCLGFRLDAHLNPLLMPDKLVELYTLVAGGVRVPEFSRTRPGPPPTWLPRTLHHSEGKDFTREMRTGDYYTKYIRCVAEYRVHVVKNRVVRAGTKIPRVDNPHPWIRSWGYGWKFSYSGQVLPGVVDLGKRATFAVGYDFAAVDIGVDERGEPLVFEVNSAPGLEGGTITAYAEVFMQAERERPRTINS